MLLQYSCSYIALGKILLPVLQSSQNPNQEFFPVGSVRSLMACFILFPRTWGSRAPFLSIWRWSSNVPLVGQLGLCFSGCEGDHRCNADLRRKVSSALVPFSCSRDCLMRPLKISALLLPLGEFPYPPSSPITN